MAQRERAEHMTERGREAHTADAVGAPTERPPGAGSASLEADDAYMREALALAERGRGFTSPNPVVGAVVVRHGRIVGRGWHARYGAPHAETMALDEAGELARDATLYVTLEPCCFWGKTPPCTDAIARAGIREVVFAVEDPNPAVCGGGLAALRGDGIEVRTGVLAEEATAANVGYLRYRTIGLPSVLLKLALSLDGRVAPPGGPRWTSSESSRRLVHRMRAVADCVMVGIDTVIADDPELTDRREERGDRQPWRLVLDTALRVPLESRMVSAAGETRTIVACGGDADADREEALKARGVSVWRFERTQYGVDLTSVVRRLAGEGCLYVLAEGGPRVASRLLTERLVDRVAFFICPVLYGSEGRDALGELPPVLSRRGVLTNVRWSETGGDILFEAEVSGVAPEAA